MNKQDLAVQIEAIGKLLGGFGVPFAAGIGMTVKNLLELGGMDLTGMDDEQIEQACKRLVAESRIEREKRRDGAVDAIRKRREARGE